ncbi:hypothetical protein EK0264_07105 [Epidermidibacterium keratini]|uniref:PucR family transcriptional regulator n=1 Tax=Epidermidibacterium keratini TaxID=1891644 RepID=A0A7L4YLR2_9ACTN|nr:PucR family transcriptional regulator [Epidermidibacterium keratini]QHC00070.1 hypothetical protein EK0264_07105 [Epidermidibacterium keratini]
MDSPREAGPAAAHERTPERLEQELRLHQDLLSTLGAHDPVGSLVARVAAHCDGSAVLYDESGTTIAASGQAPRRLLWQELGPANDAARLLSVGRWTARARTVLILGSRLQLVVASRTPTSVRDDGVVVLDAAAAILAAAGGIRSVTMAHRRTDARRLMASLESGLPSSQIAQTWARLEQFGLSAGRPLRLVVGEPRPRKSGAAALSPVDTLTDTAVRLDLGLLLSEGVITLERPAALCALVADDDALGSWLDQLATTHLAGASRSFTDLTAVPQRLREADAALRLITTRHRRGAPDTSLRMDDVDLASWVLASCDRMELHGVVAEQLRPLADSPDLVRTVVTYLANDQSLRRTAEALYVHVNTVRYRVARIEALLGDSLSNAAVVANLYLALQDEILAERAAPGA